MSVSQRRLELDMKELEAVLARAKEALPAADHEKLVAAVETLAYLTGLVEEKGTTIARLRRIIFGSSSEKTRDVLPSEPSGEEAEDGEDASEDNAGPQEPGEETAEENDTSEKPKPKPRPKGHGRNGAEAYRGAKTIEVAHESLKPGDSCRETGCKGRLRLLKPAVLLRIRGQAPLGGDVIKKERLRCDLCGTVFTAKSPEGVGEEKYDASAVAMMVLLRYGVGLPLNRLERLQGDLGIPLPSSTQWDVAHGASPKFSRVYEELIRQAAQGKILHNDDTSMTILEYLKEDRERRNRGDPPDRSGIFTSGIVSVDGDRRIALFFTGRNHAGENLTRVLAERNEELDAAIQMCDALSRNVSSEFAAIVCNCIAHARRQFVEVVERFPEECSFVLETLEEVFKNDSIARRRKLTAEERLEFHRRESRRLLAELRLWAWRQFRDRLIEPNSGLGKAIKYLRKHWRKLTRFLFVAGAPLDNNVCERILKSAIVHRKNSLFFKTANGARVGDIYMSLIATCQLAGANPFDYLTEVGRHALEAAAEPDKWLPWNYEAALGREAESEG